MYLTKPQVLFLFSLMSRLNFGEEYRFEIIGQGVFGTIVLEAKGEIHTRRFSIETGGLARELPIDTEKDAVLSPSPSLETAGQEKPFP